MYIDFNLNLSQLDWMWLTQLITLGFVLANYYRLKRIAAKVGA